MTEVLPKAKFACGGVLRSDASKHFALGIVVGLTIISCRATTPQSQVTDFEVSESQDNGLSVVEDPNVNESPQDERKFTMRHPKEPTAWFTRKLLMTSQQPSAKRINECRERVEAAIKDAPNLHALAEVSLTLEDTIMEAPNLYHWCFYQMMADLDLRLENDTSLMGEKAEVFLTRMRSLWAMARALDLTLPDRGYMTYLRVRYTDISQTIFGRILEPMDIESFRLQKTGQGKSASAYKE
jgi:hypothetical protein